MIDRSGGRSVAWSLLTRNVARIVRIGENWEIRVVLMAEKSERRRMLEQSLAEDPTDTFLRYGLAMQCLRDGDIEEGRERLKALIADHPDDQVSAYQQLGQSFLEEGDAEEARRYFLLGIEKANARGDWHAASEMQGFLEQLD